MEETPPEATDYTEAWKAGWAAGYQDGKGAGFTDAKVRARLAMEAAADHLDLTGTQRKVLLRTSDNIVGKVE